MFPADRGATVASAEAGARLRRPVNAGLAAGLAFAAVWLWCRPPEHGLLRRLNVRPADVAPRPPRTVPRWAVALAGLGVVAAAGVVAGRPAAVLSLAVLVLGGAVAELWLRAARRRAEHRRRLEVVRACDTMAGMLRIGAVPVSALAAAAADHPVLSEAAALQEVGGSVSAALRRSGQQPGCEGLAEVGVAWEVALRTGAALSDAVDAVAADLDRREELAGQVRIELAASRTAGRVMAGLPLVGLAIGYAAGGDPARFLVDNPIGNGCLVAAALLAGAGLVWSDSLAERAAR